MMDEGLFDPFGLYAFMGSSHAAHWCVLAAILISGLSWVLTKPGTGIRKLCALTFGGEWQPARTSGRRASCP